MMEYGAGSGLALGWAEEPRPNCGASSATAKRIDEPHAGKPPAAGLGRLALPVVQLLQ